MTAVAAPRSDVLSGTPASAGIAQGRAVLCRCGEPLPVPRRLITEAEGPAEMARFDAAVTETYAELLRLEGHIGSRSGAAGAAIFAAQRQMLHDPLLRKEVANRVARDRLNIEAAVSEAADALAAAFNGIADPVFAERAADIRDIARRLLRRLLQRNDADIDDLPADGVVVARELLPSLAAGLDGIRGLVAEQGGTTAHAVILARSLGIPTLIHVEHATETIRPGDALIVDGLAGHVFVNPPEHVRREYARIEAGAADRRRTLGDLVGLPSVTADGVPIRLSANVGSVADASVAAAVRADGIGLYRTEFAFLAHPQFPTEEQQYRLYRAAAELVAPHPVVLRVLDIGSDKRLPYFPLPPEPNPALGRRGTRLLLACPEVLQPQLRAMLRLGATHPVAVLFPMIGGVGEFRAARAAVAAAAAGLRHEGTPCAADPRVGAMIETPGAVLLARELAREADFLSIGTNDLVQYLLTADRTSSALATYYEPRHPAVVRALKAVIEAARAEGKPLSICGEIAGDPAYTELLIGLGVTSLSLAPGELLEIKRVVRSVRADEARRHTEEALAATTVAEVKAIVRRSSKE